MKKQTVKRILALLSAVALFGCGIVAAQEAAPNNKETNILLWGASGCGGISHMLPEMAKDIGQTVTVRVLSRSFNRYPVAIRAAEAGKRAPDGIDPGTLPDKGAEHGYVNLEKDRSIQVHVLDEIKSKKWDVIIIALNTHMAVYPKAYPDLSTVFDFSKKYNPQAKMVVFQRPAPPNDGQLKIPGAEKAFRAQGILKLDEILTEDRWAMVSSQYHLEWAENRDVTLILTGDVVYWARRDKQWGFPPLPNHVEAKKYYDSLVFGKDESRYPNDRRFRIGFKLLADSYRVDHHPSFFGSYIVAATAFEVIFGTSVVGNSYAPILKKRNATNEDIAILQRIVHETIKDHSKYPLYERRKP